MKVRKQFSSQEQYQSSLLTDIFEPSSLSGLSERTLKVYQNNLLMTASRSLSLSYPVLEKMVGEQAMYVLARRLLVHELPNSGDWADWGTKLSELIALSELHEPHPYLADIAYFEWTVHQSARAQAGQVDVESLRRLTQKSIEQIVLTLQPSLTLCKTNYPAHAIWLAHGGHEANNTPTSEELEFIMQSKQSQFCSVISAGEVRPQITDIDQHEYDWLQGIQQGLTVSALLDTFPAIDFATWLNKSVQMGWLSKVSSV